MKLQALLQMDIYQKDKMYLHYNRNKGKKGGRHTHNMISINKQSSENFDIMI